ncbi:MAG: homocysteine S-methyltransferase [Actinomycetales bacterium]|nr:homocysteine S-methyltransferase [Actinomycetales bacterium]
MSSASPPTRARSLVDALAAGEVIVLDGGFSTQLEARGHDLSDSLWSARLLLDDPTEIRAAHADFFAAGARIATTASYQVSESGFQAAGRTAAQAREALRRSVIEARVAADTAQAHDGLQRWVAGSVGPYGATLADGSEYRGDDRLSVAELRAWHRPRLHALADADPDVLAVETIPSLREVEALCAELDTLGMPFWLSVTPHDGRLRPGEPLAAAYGIVASTSNRLAVGANCCDPAEFDPVASAARQAADGIPVVFYPNSGETWDAIARRWTGAPTIPGLAANWVASGARLVGGCCRVTPDQIRTVAASVTSTASTASTASNAG